MNPRRQAVILQQRRTHHLASNADAYAFFNLLTGPELFEQVESLLPEHRERQFPPTETLSMFMAQALSESPRVSWRLFRLSQAAMA
jgi:hypothetical protein